VMCFVEMFWKYRILSIRRKIRIVS
jgi:hypothetical protein